MKILYRLLFMVLLLLSLQPRLQAQVMDTEVAHIADSLMNDSVYAGYKFQQVDTLDYFQVYDSVALALVQQYIAKDKVAKGKYNWPFRTTDPYEAAYTDPSYRYLLREKYRIDMPEYTGCVYQATFTIYDSLIRIEIEKAYGKDFFQRSIAELAKLHQQRRALQLPRIGRKTEQESADIVMDAFRKDSFLRMNLEANKKDSLNYLLAYYKDGKLLEVSPGMNFLGGIQADWELAASPIADMCLEKMNTFKMKAPTFDKKGYSGVIVYDFLDNKAYFRP